jgi:hypothetical protein
MGTRGHVLAVMSMIEAQIMMQQSARSSEHTAMHEVEPRDFVDESGNVMESLSNVRPPPLYLCAALTLDL